MPCVWWAQPLNSMCSGERGLLGCWGVGWAVRLEEPVLPVQEGSAGSAARSTAGKTGAPAAWEFRGGEQCWAHGKELSVTSKWGLPRALPNTGCCMGKLRQGLNLARGHTADLSWMQGWDPSLQLKAGS